MDARRLHVMMVYLLIAFGCGCDVPSAPAQDQQDSGGPLLPEQAAYDVTYYDLDLHVQPANQHIEGRLVVEADVTAPLEQFVLDLDRRLEVHQVALVREDGPQEVSFERRAEGGQLWIMLPRPYDAGERLIAEVAYRGAPRLAPDPPWDGGFTWTTTPDGAPWIATSCQTVGADVWWPVKDHPSDEPDSMAIAVTVPDSLVVASNGRLRDASRPADSLRTFHWFVSMPVNSYAVALNIAPYEQIDTTYASTSGADVPVSFFVLPHEENPAREALPDLLDQMRFLEETLRPYPFGTDKYGIARTPFLGMEHQTIIAHGAELGSTRSLGYPAGFDALHFHELAHEWFGNYVTVRDWKDFWIHEGFATYLEALYAEELDGESAYADVTDHFRRQIADRQPIVRREPTSIQDIYERDVYFKGAMVLHTLRFHIGDDAFFAALRRMGGAEFESPVFVETADFVRIVEEEAGQELDWFFETYLYHAEQPQLVTERNGDQLTLRWETPSEEPFPMPLDVQIDGETQRVAMEEARATLSLPTGATVTIDPRNRVLHTMP